MSQSGKVHKDFGSIGVAGSNIEVASGTALGALSLASKVTDIRTTGAATAQLADGKQGQEKIIVMTVDGGDCVLTPANLAAGTTLTFNDVGDSAHLVFLKSDWHVVSGSATLA